ncbi:hypothetical protein [Pelagibaculum spongiae]|nr:hypothetical protein [Pelagibaculum spongiae]
MGKKGFKLGHFGRNQARSLLTHQKPAYFGFINKEATQQATINLTPYVKMANSHSFSKAMKSLMTTFDKVRHSNEGIANIFPLLIENKTLDRALQQNANGYWSIYLDDNQTHIIPKNDKHCPKATRDYFQPIYVEEFTKNLSVIYVSPSKNHWFEKDILSSSDIDLLELTPLELEAAAITNQTDFCITQDYTELEKHPDYGFLHFDSGGLFAASTLLNPMVLMNAEDNFGSEFAAYICSTDLLIITAIDPVMQQNAVNFAIEHYSSGVADHFFPKALIYQNGCWSEGEAYIGRH